MDITTLIQAYTIWLQNGVDLKIANNENGYSWLFKSLQYSSNLTVADYQTFFDRTDLNNQYAQRYNNTSLASQKQYAWIQNEINMIYSFHKCFAMRNHNRLLYRHDLSQKGARNLSCINIGLGKFISKQQLAEQ